MFGGQSDKQDNKRSNVSCRIESEQRAPAIVAIMCFQGEVSVMRYDMEVRCMRERVQRIKQHSADVM